MIRREDGSGFTGHDASRELKGSTKAIVGSNRWSIIAAAAIFILFAGFTVGMALMQTGKEPDTPPDVSHPPATLGHETYPLIEADDAGAIRFEVEQFGDGVARFYTYMNGDQPIEFLVLQSADGVVRAAFYACDSCYRDLRGYSQDGQIMICNNCGQQFPAEKINVVRGGCNPGPLERVVEDAELVIQEADVILGASYF